jgi:hypothetical protein
MGYDTVSLEYGGNIFLRNFENYLPSSTTKKDAVLSSDTLVPT